VRLGLGRPGLGGAGASRASTATVVLAVAGIAAYISYWHAYAVIRQYGESGVTALLEPGTIDGLVYASSMIILYAARHRLPVPQLARWKERRHRRTAQYCSARASQRQERGSAAAALMASAASSASRRRSGRAYWFLWTAQMTWRLRCAVTISGAHVPRQLDEMPAAVMSVSGIRWADSRPRAMRASGVSVADSVQARYTSHSQSGTARTTNHHPGSPSVGSATQTTNPITVDHGARVPLIKKRKGIDGRHVGP
jgi:hypothetical protein